ncbi:hypothetical protein B0J11DRAFT_508682 [Dendryphion nanum]|uniref:Uncharacterized protein n=1 Tax=Dendryphion nanum TaxID=256645 RepID=A0A9P9IH64_9PLEO|nr:hypothetical protein B0J11DRAFT_508682 [Dendryphion nanum]
MRFALLPLVAAAITAAAPVVLHTELDTWNASPTEWVDMPHLLPSRSPAFDVSKKENSIEENIKRVPQCDATYPWMGCPASPQKISKRDPQCDAPYPWMECGPRPRKARDTKSSGPEAPRLSNALNHHTMETGETSLEISSTHNIMDDSHPMFHRRARTVQNRASTVLMLKSTQILFLSLPDDANFLQSTLIHNNINRRSFTGYEPVLSYVRRSSPDMS